MNKYSDKIYVKFIFALFFLSAEQKFSVLILPEDCYPTKVLARASVS